MELLNYTTYPMIYTLLYLKAVVRREGLGTLLYDAPEDLTKLVATDCETYFVQC